MRKKVIIVIVGVLSALLLLVALQPSDFRVERSITVAAPAAVVFAEVNDFHRWEAWSPWAKMDPAMKQTYEGAPAGVGAVYSWVGNGQVGEGRMTILESKPGELVRINLEFFKPFAATNTATFVFTPTGDQTTVTWSMTGKNNFVGKAMCLVMSMDKMVGGEFEKGLADIKSLAEAAAKK